MQAEKLQQNKESTLQKLFTATNPQKNIWVSANAGTGKTYILIRRIIRLLIAGNAPEKILCITFTNAAANEMQNRIIDEASKLILLSDSNLAIALAEIGEVKARNFAEIRKNLEYIIDAPEHLKIQTIHGFCQSILKKFPLEAGIVPFFDVLDEFKQNQLLEDAWRVLAHKIPENIYLELIENSSINDVKSRTFELIKNSGDILAVIKNHDGFEGYLQNLQQKFGITETSTRKLVSEFFTHNLPEITSVNSNAAKVLASSLKAVKALGNIIEFQDVNSLKAFVKKDKGEYITDIKSIIKHSEIHSQLVGLRVKIEQFIANIKDIETYNSTKNYLKTFELLNEIYEQKKQDQHFLDYDDLIEKAYQLLNNSEFREWVLYKLDGGIDHLLVDEAQDTSQKQWKIINQVSGEFFSGENVKEKPRTLFVVGDEKQSIYGFQGADIKNYLQAKNSLKQNLERVSLELSYRSLPAILKFTDEVFSQNFTKNKVTDEPQINHSSSRENSGFGKVELVKQIPYERATQKRVKGIKPWLLPQEYAEDDELKNKAQLAQNIAAKINAIIASRQSLPCLAGKAVEPKDIMILIKRRGSDILSSEIERSLKQFNINASNKEKLDISKNLAIKDLLSLFKFCLNPNDNLNLAVLLKSCFFNLSEQQIFDLCSNRRQNLVALIEGYDLGLHNSLQQVRQQFNDSVSIYNFYISLINNFGFRKKLTAYFGQNITQFVNIFLNKVREFEAEDNFSNESFISYFENNEIQVTSQIEASENSVKILTVHGSKGLQAPIVILANAADFSDKKNDIILNQQNILIADSSSKKNRYFTELEDAKNSKEYDEYFRLLYVALTRAKDELYIFSAQNNTAKKQEKSWYNYMLQAAQNLGDVNESGNLTFTSQTYEDSKNNSTAAPKNNNEEIQNIPKYFTQKINLINRDTISPSQLLASNNDNSSKATSKPPEIIKNVDFSFGNAVHKLLEYLPDIQPQKHLGVSEYLLSEFNLEAQTKAAIISEVTAVLNTPEIANLFAFESKAEVPIAGFAADKFVSGFIDRLIFKSDAEIIIADYKTNRDAEQNIEKLIEKYTPQMDLYKQIIAKIYPQKQVRACLIFTLTKQVIYL